MTFDTYAALPAELKQRPQWVCHKQKVPYNARSRKMASSTNPNTWSTFKDARAASQKRSNGFSGNSKIFVCPLVNGLKTGEWRFPLSTETLDITQE